MAYLLGSIVGGVIGVYLLAALWEWALFKRINDDPLKGKLTSVLAAYVTGAALAGFGMADGGPYYWGAFLQYLIPSLIVGFIAYRRGLKLRGDSDPNLVETFD